MDATIDWNQLEAISDGFSPEFLEIFQELKSEVPKLLAQMDASLKSKDLAQVARLAHRLKGAVINFGFLGVAGLLEQLEAQAKSENPEGIHDKLEQIEKSYSKGLTSLEEKIYAQT